MSSPYGSGATPAKGDAAKTPSPVKTTESTPSVIEFLELLGYTDSERLAVCHQLPDKSEPFTTRVVPATPEAVTTEAQQWVDTHNLWMSVNPIGVPAGYSGRGTASHVTRWAAIYADLDIKTGGLPSFEAARAVIDTVSSLIEQRPVAVIHSGHGLQPVWSLDPDDEATRLTNEAGRQATARAIMRRFGRLVAHVAETLSDPSHRGTVDTVYDLARVLRMPNTVNRKSDPVPTSLELTGGSPLTVATLADQLDAYGITELTGDRDGIGETVSDPNGWGWATGACNYAPKTLSAWAAAEPTKGRHPWLINCATRLAAMHRSGCLTEPEHRRGAEILARRMTELCEQGIGDTVRQVADGEIRDALSWGQAKIASKADDAIGAELGSHKHPTTKSNDGDSGEVGAADNAGAARVLAYVAEHYSLHLTPQGEAFAVPLTGPRLAVLLGERGGRLRDAVVGALYEDSGYIVSARQLDSAFQVIMAQVRRLQRHTPLHLRVAWSDDSLVIDLAQPGTARCIMVGPNGWTVQDNPPDGVLFRRSGSTKPLPDPTPGGSLDPLRELLGYATGDHRWDLVRGWLVGATVPDIARPVLLFVGQSGCAKTTRGRLTLSVLEPHTELGSSFGKNIKDDQVKALGRFLVGYDNINSVSEAVSDHLCRLVTGEEVDTRRLFTDNDMLTVSYRRSGVLTALAMPNLRADALQRLVVVTVDPISEDDRKGENGFTAQFAELHPVILGGLCDALVGMLRRLPAARAEARKRPRMADYADVLAAYDQAASRAYADNDREGMVDAAEASPFVGAVLEWLANGRGVTATPGEDGTTVHTWEGTPTEAWKQSRQHLAMLDDWDRQRSAPEWPKDAARFVDELTVAATPLRAVGVTFERKRTKAQRTLVIQRVVTLGEEREDRAG